MDGVQTGLWPAEDGKIPVRYMMQDRDEVPGRYLPPFRFVLA